jgi:signal transduction histidine kinase
MKRAIAANLSEIAVFQNSPPISPRWMYVAIGALGLTLTLIVAYGFFAGERIHQMEEPLVDATHEIKLEASSAMLWLERANEMPSKWDAPEIWQDVNRAFWHLRTSLLDSELFKGFLQETDETHIQTLFADINEKLAILEKLTQEGSGEGGRPRDLKRSKETYAAFLNSVDRLEKSFLQLRSKAVQRFRFSQGLLLFFSLGISLAVGFVCRRYERLYAESFRNLQQAISRMESEMAIRWKAEAELRQARDESEKLVALRTEELRSANRSLREEIAERCRIEDHLQESRSMLQTVVDGISDPLVLVDRDMKIKMMNQTATGYYGFNRPEDFVGRVCRNAFGKACMCDTCRIPEAVRGGLKTSFERKGLMDPRRLEQVTIYPVSNGQHKAGDAVIRVTDITEARMMQQGMIRNEKMAALGVLVSSVAHEINNPNNFISFNMPILRGYLEELLPMIDAQAALKPDLEIFNMPYSELREDLFKLLDNIEHGSGRISAFVSNLREFSEAGEAKHNRWVDLRSIIDKVIELCRNKLKRSVKSFELDIPDKLPAVFTEPFSLEQVLINLVINAVQSLDKDDTWVKVSVSISPSADSRPGEVAIRVSDNGCGLDENTRQQIFEPFFTTKPPGEGTGLGLYVSHSLIEGLGGRIDVTSEVGIGSTFTVLLPLQQPETAAPAAWPMQQAPE